MSGPIELRLAQINALLSQVEAATDLSEKQTLVQKINELTTPFPVSNKPLTINLIFELLSMQNRFQICMEKINKETDSTRDAIRNLYKITI